MKSTSSNNIGNNNVQSVERALNILQIIAHDTNPVSIAQIVSTSGLNRTTAWRLLMTLEECGFVEKDPLSKGYQLGYNASRLCPDVQEQYTPLIRLAKPFMESLLKKINEDVLLTVPRFGGMLTIYQLHSENAVMIRDYSMILSPFHCSSNGKLYLSYLDEEELEQILKQPLEKITPHTITDVDELRKEINHCRETNCGFSLEENGEGEHGFSVPVMQNGKPLAFINLSGPSFRLTEEKMNEYLPIVRETCQELSRKLSVR